MKRIIAIGLFLTLAVTFSVFASGEKPAEAPAVAEKPFEGVSLTVATLEGIIGYPWRTWAQDWAEENGATVTLTTFAFTNMYEKIMTELIFGGGKYDIIQHPSFWIGDVSGMGFTIPLDDYIAQKDPDWDDYMPVFRDRLSKWGGKTYALQVDGDVYVLAYRKDLFDHSEEQRNFKAKYGYNLAPPDTWDQYYDIAEFFTRKTGEKLAGKTLDHDFAGAVEGQKRGGGMGSIWFFLAHYASYLDTPMGVYSGDIYFDPDTMKPRFNNPAGVRAIEDLIKAAEPTRSVAEALSVDWSLMQDLFVGDQVAMCYAWPDLGSFSMDPNRSKIIGKAGFAPLPGSTEVYDLEKKRWVDWDGVHRACPLAWGWEIVISNTCKNPDAAYDLLHYMVTGDRAVKQAISPDDGLDPYRVSQFENPEVKKAFEKIDTYLPALRQCIEYGVPDLLIPQTVAYYDVIELWMDKAKQGELSPKAALGRAEEDWEKITDSAGRIKQKTYYRLSLGLTGE